MKRLFSLIFCFVHTVVFSATYYVSPTGNDNNNGSLALPFRTITKAVSSSVAGDIIYLRGGVHVLTARISISKNGTATNRFRLLAYPGDARPVLDFSALSVSDANRGISLSGNYWHFYGFDIFKSGDNGLHISGDNNIIEFCSFYENADSGCQLSNGAANNQIINCDSYFNKDATDGDADGFAVKLDVGTGNSFKGCRAWQNSDDGWDGLLSSDYTGKPSTTYDSCWCFMNGYLKSGVASVGNGNGFKMGGGGTSSARKEHHATLTRCVAAFNRVKGFDQNNNAGSMILYNCIGYRNAPNYGMSNLNPYSPNVMILKNCISFSNTSSSNSFASAAVQEKNSWQSPFSASLSAASFLSVDSIGLRAPRNTNGSLPHINFLKLASGSNMIDGGVNVGLPFNGAAPDLGAFETAATVPVNLLSFEAIIKNEIVVLQWKTATELNNKGWEIEKVNLNSTNPFVWQKMGFVAGSKENNTVKSYAFDDKDVVNNQVYLFRLKQIDLDGTVKYSNVLTIKIGKTKNDDLSVYPNPVKSLTNIQFSIEATSKVQLMLFNQQGQMIKIISNEQLTPGIHNKQISLDNLPAGSYVLKLVTNKFTLTKEVIKQP
jgi:hypothetical protein